MKLIVLYTILRSIIKASNYIFMSIYNHIEQIDTWFSRLVCDIERGVIE